MVTSKDQELLSTQVVVMVKTMRSRRKYWKLETLEKLVCRNHNLPNGHLSKTKSDPQGRRARPSNLHTFAGKHLRASRNYSRMLARLGLQK